MTGGFALDHAPFLDGAFPAFFYATVMQSLFTMKQPKRRTSTAKVNLLWWLFYFIGYMSIRYFTAPIVVPAVDHLFDRLAELM